MIAHLSGVHGLIPGGVGRLLTSEIAIHAEGRKRDI